ncbi:uncharacterized protein Z519_05511 [Cladophialophora bantiana CBS 173.52]|uniref:Cytochrome P450 oxidoreductase n=1 Tax=Cladophialophora bantiana (strain ATCC 10958 / CBS 173.52 / CDC B-1940 / NIH 8579) TaxID=1442370 RepID=A0A0D2HTM0_CLAB1|nr:uncharacterized protein Z519_05511 [Cladophialophora bantiana CBS 173.52]KIW94195.1 hypothetical protein Z519_05511 [Cladophialophora bantiana CBS 173.52]
MTSLDASAAHPSLASMRLGEVAANRQILSLPVLALLIYIFYQRYFSPLSKVPGPFLASFTNLWWLSTVLKEEQHLDCLRLHRGYGPFVRIGPNQVMIADPETFKKIYGAGNNFQKSDFYKPFKAKLKWSLTAETDGHVHSQNRRMVSRPYSMDSIRSLEGFVDQVIEHFLEKMKSLTIRPFDLGEWLALFAIGNITEISFAKSFNYLDKGDADGILALSKVVFASANWVGVVPWVYRIHHLTSDWTGNWLGVTMRSIKFRALAQKKVQEHQLLRDENEDHRSILGNLQDLRRKKPDEFSEYAMTSALTSNIFAGSDTTAIALRAMIYNLLSHPSCLERFLHELKERQMMGEISDPIRFHEAEAWPFLQAIMYESLRLHPPFAAPLPRVVPQGGLVVKDVFLPAGTVVGTNAWAIHRRSEIFGDNVDEFCPERWMDPATKSELQRYFFAFGGGARTCLGRSEHSFPARYERGMS